MGIEAFVSKSSQWFLRESSSLNFESLQFKRESATEVANHAITERLGREEEESKGIWTSEEEKGEELIYFQFRSKAYHKTSKEDSESKFLRRIQFESPIKLK
jgi:hypothetical protein